MRYVNFTKLFILILVIAQSIHAQPVAITTIIAPNDMELKLINEQERDEKVSMSEVGPSEGQVNPTINTIANNQAGTSALQFDNLPKIVSEITNNFEGSFEVKNQQKKKNEELCGQKLNEMKQLVESQLKRSIYKVECTEPEFARLDGQKMQFSSKATITFF